MKKISHYIKNGIGKVSKSFFPLKIDFKTYDIAVIGGGINGLSIARKAAMRGQKVVLIERDDIGSGTSGHFHELLHSGVRYALHDPAGASECYEANQFLRSPQSVVKEAIQPTGGLFIAVTDSDVEYSQQLVPACQKLGIPIDEIDLGKISSQEPYIAKNVKRILRVPDACIDGKKTIEINKNIAKEFGVELLTHHSVISFRKKDSKLETITVRNRAGEDREITCGFVINAGGPWSSQIAKLAGVEFSLFPTRGAMIVFKDKLSNHILNHCRKPSDGDIIVPARGHTILGTTSEKTDIFDNFDATDDEVNILLGEGEQLIPGLSKHTIIKKYAGVRPQYSSTVDVLDGRNVTRSFAIIDHNKRDGIKNFISVVGGKFMLYEKMSDMAISIMIQNLRNSFPKYDRAYMQEE